MTKPFAHLPPFTPAVIDNPFKKESRAVREAIADKDDGVALGEIFMTYAAERMRMKNIGANSERECLKDLERANQLLWKLSNQIKAEEKFKLV